MMITEPFKSPVLFFNSIIILSILALISAFIAEYIFELDPCILCLYQRWPFVFAIGLAMLGRGGRMSSVFMTSMCALLSLNFSLNSALAFYHSGVELKWWVSIFEGCAVPDFNTTSSNILDTIMNAPTTRCDEIPWADPFFNLSMANYNVLFCAGLALCCLIAVFTLKKNHQHQFS